MYNDDKPLATKIEGHTDDLEPRELGLRRAMAVKQYLIVAGLKEEKITDVKNIGSDHPVCSEPMEECRAKNRRAVTKTVYKFTNR
jgi:outer membrane protein OmpA-like peptidoglycan-associated protein